MEGVSCGLVVVSSEDNAADVEADLCENIEQSDNVHVVCDPQISPDLVLFDVVRVDNDNDLSIVLELKEHLQLTVRLKSRQYTGSVIVVEELSAELKVELVAELSDALTDML